MVDEPDNLVLQLLREIRSDVGDVKRDVAELKARMTTLEARVTDLEEGQAMILGYLTQAKWRDERLARDLTLIANRVTVLEVHTGLHTTS